MINRKLLILCCLAVLSCGAANARKVWSLDDCIKYACENKTDVNRRHNDIEASRLQLKREKSRYIPTIEANVTPAFSTGMNMDIFVQGDFLYLPAQISGSVPLLDFGIKNDKKVGEYGLKASEAYYKQSRQETAVAVTSYYLQALYAKNAYSLAQEMAGISLENLEYVKRCLAEGAVPESEKVKAELALAADENNVLSTKGLLETALMELRYFINGPDSIDVVEPLISEGFQNHNSISSFPGVAAREFELSKSEAALKSAKTSLLPTLSLNLSAGGFTYNAFTNMDAIPYDKSFWNNRTAAVWLSLNIPIIDKARKRTAIQMQAIEVKNCKLALDQTRLEYEKTIDLLRSRLETEMASDVKLAAIVNKAGSNYRAEKDRYEGGIGSWFDLQEAKKQLEQARMDALNNHIRYLMDSKALELYLGQ